MMNPTIKRVTIRTASAAVSTFTFMYALFVLLAVFTVDPADVTGADYQAYLSDTAVVAAAAAVAVAAIVGTTVYVTRPRVDSGDLS